jgi:hypothetical protein
VILPNVRARLSSLAICGFFLLSVSTTAQGDSVTSFLDASLTTGSLAGTSFVVSFSYDNSSLTGTGQEFLSLLSFNFTLLGTQFITADIKQGGQAIFQNGTLENVTAAFFPPSPLNAPVSDIAFGFGGPGIIGYIDLNRQFGEGSYSLASTVPEPPTFLSLLLGLGALLLVRKSQSVATSGRDSLILIRN